MRGASLDVRARAIIDKLDERIEQQTMREGADAPHCVAAVGAWHTFAGYFERKLDRLAKLGQRSAIAAELKILKRVAHDHKTMVDVQGTLVRMARRATVSRAIKAAKRGAQ